jgi:hypothetical protein
MRLAGPEMITFPDNIIIMDNDRTNLRIGICHTLCLACKIEASPHEFYVIILSHFTECVNFDELPE